VSGDGAAETLSMSSGETVLFIAGAVVTVVLLVAAVVLWVVLHRQERRAEAEAERSGEAEA
jgi:TctA family transporter